MGVAWGLLFLVTMTSSACIVPVPLDREQPPADSPPTIVAGSAMPQPLYPQLVTHQLTDTFEFSFLVDDPDLDDILTARMFYSTDETQFSEQTLLSAGDNKHPDRRDAIFGPLQFCTIFDGDGQNPQTPVTIIVSDRVFTNQIGPDTVGLTAEVDWLLQCN